MNEVLRAIFYSIKDLFHPRLIRFLLLPVLVGLGLGILFWVMLFGPLQVLTESWALAVAQWNFWPDLFRTMLVSESGKWGLFWVFFPLLAIIIVPIAVMLTVGLSSVFALPVIQRHLKDNYSVCPEKRGRFLSFLQIKNILVSTAFYIFLSAASFFMWFIPLLGPLVSMFNLTYFNYRVFIFDALSEHATEEEILAIKKQNKMALGFFAFLLTVTAVIPFGFFFYPVFGALLHSHWGLRKLSANRV